MARDAVVREHYDTPLFEREVAMPDRVQVHCQHLAKLLRVYGRMEKTIVFCVSMDHAEQVRDALNKLNADLNVANYAVRIVSEEADAKTLLEKFQAVEKPTPVIATTVDLLTTGVDAPSVRNIVFFKSVASPTVFKQMVGRGSRLCEDTDKYWFRIIDYTGATALFDEWDAPTPPSEGGATHDGPRVCWLGGMVISAEDGKPLVDAVVTVQLGPNEILQQRTGSDGQFLLRELPAGQVIVTAAAYGHNRTQVTVTTAEGQPAFLSLPLPQPRAAQRSNDQCQRLAGADRG